MEEIIEAEKIREIALIGDAQKEVVLKSIPLLAIPYMPITKDFIQDWILTDVEYPTFEGKISQAATEMRVRLGSLLDQNYQFKVCELEIRELELDIVDIRKNEDISPARKEVQIARKQLDIQMKSYRLHSIRQGAEMTYAELVNWIQTVDDGVQAMSLKHPEIKSFKDIDFNSIRCTEMKLKIAMWEERAKHGPLTPSQENLVRAKALQAAKQRIPGTEAT